jgi:hypothetical protein
MDVRDEDSTTKAPLFEFVGGYWPKGQPKVGA